MTVGRATIVRVVPLPCAKISIHALRGEGDFVITAESLRLHCLTSHILFVSPYVL